MPTKKYVDFRYGDLQSIAKINFVISNGDPRQTLILKMRHLRYEALYQKRRKFCNIASTVYIKKIRTFSTRPIGVILMLRMISVACVSEFTAGTPALKLFSFFLM